jgi:hypothetical protein
LLSFYHDQAPVKKFIYDFFRLFLLGKGATVGFIAVVAVVASAAAYFIASSLLTPTQVNQPIITQVNEPPVPPVPVDVASQLYHKFIGMNEQDRMHAAAQMTPKEVSLIMMEAARVSTGINEVIPGLRNQPVASLSSGSFVGTDGHLAEGIARILTLNAAEYLRFEQFKVTNGPDLHVYLTSIRAGIIQNGTDLGLLKASEGDQNYFLGRAGGTKLDTVMILSPAFRVVFATATLR